MAHAREIPVLVDGCQAAPHLAVNVQELGCDFYVFAGHKVYGPTGIGVLYGRYDLLNSLPPFLGGGDMISSVSFEKTTFKKAPFRFEAGTPAIVESVGLAKAIDYVSDIGLPAIHAHEDGLLAYATERLTAIDGLTIYGQAKDKAAVISFTLESAHPHDIGTILDRAGVAVRAGHHCAQPTMERFGVPATVRASFGLYNTRAEVDALVDAINQVKELFE
jgi:cysteine desulfurase/selenocysteine lyase